MLQTKPKSEADSIVDSAIARVGEIATLPEVTVKIIQIVEDPKSTAHNLHEVIKNDPALASRLLKVVNSAFYGLPGQIASIDRAIVLLGLSAVKNIAIAASMTHLFNSGVAIDGFNGVEVWRHSIAVAVASRLINSTLGRPAVEESFLSGLIHDLGLLVERQVFPKKIAQVIARHQAEPSSFSTLEQEIIGADHQAFGMALGKKWRFPAVLCTVIGYHHHPMDLAPVNRNLAVHVHIADVIAAKANIGFTATAANEDFDDEMLDIVKLAPKDLQNISEQLPEQVAIAESIFSE